jgi:vacuolar-type H+-ATPase catalytic subunit A/Vma1
MAQNPYNDLLQMVKSMEDDFSKFYDKSNKAAGTRVRKSMQELKDKAQQIRLEVQNMKNEG